MPTVAYLANQFPSPVEPYVSDEIRELRRRGVTVIPCSARPASIALDSDLGVLTAETLYLQPIRLKLVIYAAFLCILKFHLLKDFFYRALLQGSEPFTRRVRALLHTWLGLYYALLIRAFHPEHIHVHHGYFSSWIAMVAARSLGIDFSMTLHGSDLLLHPAYLDLKLKECSFCVTISEFNRSYILERYPEIQPAKIMVRRMGVEPGNNPIKVSPGGPLTMLAVGRLHPVKDHDFLIRACRMLKDRGLPFVCLIAGDGPERVFMAELIQDLDLRDEIRLLGHLSRHQLDSRYAAADLVVLTSRSEGIPLVLMEAMVRGIPVLAPTITGIPELVLDGKNGFLYRPGSLGDFVARVELVHRSESALGPLGRAARQHVLQHFNRETNLAAFCDLILSLIRPTNIRPTTEHPSYENSLLQ
ncbi:MAG: glycosyltransferase family 4 protein [Terriglobales bacterium]|jgi:glycosyltransferase involved in cell wall biosynthesis